MNLQVLIVEDNISYQVELRMLIAELGFKVIGTVSSSSEALELILASNPDVIIMDIQIEGRHSGTEIGALVKDKKIPIIFLTAHPTKQHFEEAQDSGLFAFLSKPIELFELQQTIHLLINQRSIKSPETISGNSMESASPTSIYLKNKESFVRIDIHDISYLESNGNMVTVFLDEAEHSVRRTISSFSDELEPFDFLRVHRSFMVNLNKITEVHWSDYTLVVNDKTIPCSRQGRTKLRERLKFL